MAVYDGTDSPGSLNVLAYNGNSDRGWNDPPMLAFGSTSSNAAPRKRLDLRKRVSHNCVSSNAEIDNKMQAMNLNKQMFQQPVIHQQQVYNSSVPTGPINSHHQIANKSVQHNVSQVHHASINKRMETNTLSQHGPSLLTPATMPGILSQPVVTGSSHVQSDHLVHASSMPNLQEFSSSITPQITPVISQGQSISTQYSVGSSAIHPPVMPGCDTSPVTKGESSISQHGQGLSTFQQGSATTSHVGQPLFYFSSQASHPAVANAVSTVTNDLRSSAEISLSGNTGETIKHVEAEAPKQESSIHPYSADGYDHAHHVRSTSMPNFNEVKDPGQNMIAPPVEGYYTKRASSACSSRQRTPSPLAEKKLESTAYGEQDDAQMLRDTIDKFESILEKLSVVSDVKLLDDVRKRISIFNQSWIEGKLSPKVKSKMVELASALSSKQLKEADSIHQSLIVDYSNEESEDVLVMSSTHVPGCQEQLLPSQVTTSNASPMKLE